MPALADHKVSDPERDHSADEQSQEAAAIHDNEAAVDADELPANDLTTSMGSKISSPAISGGSLHASPKILNNAGVSNDLKATLQPAAPKPAVTADSPVLNPAPAAASPPATGAETEKFNLEVAPAPEASFAEPGPPEASGAPSRSVGAGWLLLPAIGLGGLAAAGGFLVIRLLRGRNKSPS